MNVFFVVLLVLTTFIVMRIAKFVGNQLGVTPWVPALLLLAAIVMLLVVQHKWARSNARPRCINGRCGPDDYICLGFAKDGVVFRCRCEMDYSMHRGRFRFIDETGTPRPYMRRTGLLRRWVPDRGDE